MASSTIPATMSFHSPSKPSHKVFYVQLNPGAPQTLLFCYGAGDRSATLTLYQDFISKHPQMSLICIDRWTLPTSSAGIVARSGPGLLSEFTSITIELLDSLMIQKVGIAAHSAGVYPMLQLARSIPDRVENLFPICTHIPPPYTESWALSWMCRAPNVLFNIITKMDSGGSANPTVERLKSLAFGTSEPEQHDKDNFVDTPALQEVLKQYTPSPDQVAAAKERQSLDYQLVYSRLPGIDNRTLIDLYVSLREHSIPVTWFTSYDDAFFGPPAVKRLIDGTGIQSGIEMVVIEEAKHSDIHLRVEVWNGMYRRMKEGEGNGEK